MHDDTHTTKDQKGAKPAKEEMRETRIAADAASLLEVIPFALTAQFWDFSPNVSFKNTHTDIPVDGWLTSKAELERPTVVEAEIRSSGKPGSIGMTLFSETHGPLESAHYSVTTGFGEWNDGVLSLPGDERMTTGFNNEVGRWDVVRFDLGSDYLTIYINEKMIHNSTDTSLSKGKVQFLAEQEPMQVRGVQWRQDCKFSPWSAGPCGVTCGTGMLTSTRNKQANALFGGKCIGGTEREDMCVKAPCEGSNFD